MSDWIEDVHALADGELTDDKKKETMRLVDENPDAAAEYQWALFFRESLASKCLDHDCEDAWRRSKERLHALDRSSKLDGFVGRYSWAMAASLFIIIAFAGLWNRGIGGRELSGQQVAQLMSSATPLSSNDATAAMEDGLGTEFPVVQRLFDVNAVGVGEVGGSSFIRISLRDSSGPLVLYAIKGEKVIKDLKPVRGRKAFSHGYLDQHPCLSWTHNDISFLMLADREVEELISIAEQLQAGFEQ